MSFYASQFNNKSSRYCSSNLYGSNLSTVYSDGPPPLDDTLEEDDGEIVFRDKSPRTESPESKLDNDKSGPASGEPDFIPWSKNDSKGKDVADDDFGDFSGFADFSSAFGGDSKSQNDSSWFKNGDNNQSSVTNFNHDVPNHQGGISASSRKNVDKTEGSKDDDFGCFSGGDDSDFDDFSAFTSNNQNTNITKNENFSENSESKKTVKSDELFKNDKTVSKNEPFNHSLESANKPNFGSNDDSEVAPTLNGQPMSSTSRSSTSSAQNVTSNTYPAMKPTCFSDDDDDFGDFSSSSFDDDTGRSTKSPDLIINSEQTNFSSQPKANELQNANINESSKQSDKIESKHNPTESKDSDELVQQSRHNGSATHVEHNGEDTSENDHDITNIDQPKKSITMDGKESDDDDEFGKFSTSGFSVTKTEESKAKELPSSNTVGSEDFGAFGSPPDLQDDDDDGYGEFETNAAPSKENGKNDANDDDDFGDFGAASPPSPPSLHGNSDNDDDFGDFGGAFPSQKSGIHGNHEDNNDRKTKSDDDNDFGDFGAAPATIRSDPNGSAEAALDDDGDDFGNFGSAPASSKSDPHGSAEASPDDDDEFGDFGTVPATSKSDPQGSAEATCDDDDDEFGGFGSVPTTSKSDPHGSAEAAPDDDDDDDDDDFGDFGSAPSKPGQHGNDDGDDDFGDFGSVQVTNNPDDHSNAAADDDDDFGDFGSAASKPGHHGNDDGDDDFGDFGVASTTSKPNKTDDFGNFAEVKKTNSQKSKSTSDSSSLEPKTSPSDDDDDFGQFDSAPSKSSNDDFADFKSSDNTSKGFGDFSSMPSSFSSTKVPQSFSDRDVQQGQSAKLAGNSNVIKPQRKPNADRLENIYKECFTNKDIAIESNIIIQTIEREVQSERSRAWQHLLTSERDGSLRFEWVLSEHQVKMLDGLSMVPVRIQTSVSFKPKGQVPPPLFASTMGLLEPVKGVITPFHHVEEIDPSQDPFGAPPEVGVQDLGFGKGSKKETSTLHTETKDNTSDTISVSSSLDLDFLAPSNTNGESTKTESRGLFEDDLLGLGMFSEPSPSPKITNGKNIFKFNNTTIPLAKTEGSLSEQAKNVVKDFEDLSFMLSKVLMFPLKSKD